MQIKNIEDLNYDLELDKVIEQIKKHKAKIILIQLPDGLKQYATQITDYLTKQTKAKILIWMNTCYGACDTPKVDKVDLIVQFGHSEWKYN